MENFLAEEIGRLLAALFLLLPPLWFIFKKTGLSPWYSLITLLPPFPLGVLIVALLLGYKKWPNEQGAQ